MNIVLSPIGIINSPFINPYYSPRQGRIEGKKGSITLNEEYRDGLAGLQDFSHIGLHFIQRQPTHTLCYKRPLPRFTAART